MYFCCRQKINYAETIKYQTWKERIASITKKVNYLWHTNSLACLTGLGKQAMINYWWWITAPSEESLSVLTWRSVLDDGMSVSVRTNSANWGYIASTVSIQLKASWSLNTTHVWNFIQCLPSMHSNYYSSMSEIMKFVNSSGKQMCPVKI